MSSRPDPWRNGALDLAPSAEHPSTPALMSRSKIEMKMNSLVAAVADLDAFIDPNAAKNFEE